MNDETQSARPTSGGKPRTSKMPGSSDSVNYNNHNQSGAGTLKDNLKGLAAHAGEKLVDAVESEKDAGTDFAANLSGSIRRAANEFTADIPQAADYIRGAADQVDYITRSLRERNVGQLISDVEAFARRQPTAFLGATVIAGFVALRFLKSSKGGSNQASSGRNSVDN